MPRLDWRLDDEVDRMMKRRDFTALLGGAVTWPLVARAQGDVPVVGYLSSFSPETNRKFTEMRASLFRRAASSVMRPASTTPFVEPLPTWRAS